MPLLETKGAASAQGFGFTLGGPANYIEDVFQTWLYTGNGSTQTITNGIDLAGKGGLVWAKPRESAPNNGHALWDTARSSVSGDPILSTNTTDPQVGINTNYLSYLTSGFSIDSATYNASNITYVSWTFREQPKFFDVVTYTGDGTSGRTVAHNLGSVPGCMIVKKINNTGQWCVYHRGLTTPATDAIFLNLTNAQTTDPNVWNSTAPTSTVFTLGNSTGVNNNGDTYVAYLFAHNAGGFGLTGNDNVISCGSYTGTGAAGLNVTLGYEPQFVLIKRASGGTGDWNLIDTMRGWPNSTTTSYKRLLANTSAAEDDGGAIVAPTATGFTFLEWTADLNASGSTYIYIAIRRGPMKVPTTGTSVFTPTAYIGNGAGTRLIDAGFPPDIFIPRVRTGAYGYNTWVVSRLQGGGQTMAFNAQFQEQVYDTGSFTRDQRGYVTRTSTNIANPTDDSMIAYSIRRAPSYADVVCWTGNGSSVNVNHNLTVKPQMILAKNRLNSSNWFVLVGGSGRFSTNSTDAAGFNLGGGPDCFGATTTTFNTAWLQDISSNQPILNTQPYVAYLFASAPGVSRVGSFTGTGATQVINCGFTGGARFVMIKATSTTGDWYIWDSARGIVAGNDPYVLLNNSVPEVTGTDWVDTAATGFELSNSGGNLANSNGVTYIFWAIA